MSQNSNLSGSVMIVGGGIGGMQAALDLADSGFKVHMVQKDSSLGGTMVMLDKTFPTGDCSMCMISPKMVEIGRHPNIEIHTLAEVTGINGEPGRFKVMVKLQPRYVDPDKCTGCGVCEKKCPKLVTSEFEQGLTKRKAIYSLLAQAVPNTRVIDSDNCLFFQRGRCKACEKFCTAGAINFEDTGKEIEITVGSVILSPGLARYDATRHQELGLGRWPNVVSSIQFERILSASGPFSGEILRPGDKRHPRKIAWIQCVGSRDTNHGNPWCSSVCCMYATKQAIIAREHDSSIEPTIFYMELRAFGKDFDKYVDRAKNQYGVRYHRAMVSAVHEEAGTGNLILRYADTDGTLVDEMFDMVVLSVGLEPHRDAIELAKTFAIEPNRYGFAKTGAFTPVDTTRPGIFVTGTYQGPKDIPETVTQGSAVAGKAMALLGEARGSEIVKKELPPETDVGDAEARIGVLVCHCGINIAQTVNIEEVVEAAKGLPNVVYAADLMYACSQDSQQTIKDLVREHNLNRVVVASCTPRTHQPLFQETIRDAGLNKYLFELADIREQCAWCHMGQNKEATAKAIDIVKMVVAKVKRFEPVHTDSVPVTHGAMVIGGGVAGMTAALALGDQGYDVHIVEKTDTLGGLAKNVYRTLDGSDVQAFLAKQIEKILNHPRITVHTGVEIKSTDGFVGNFNTTLSDGSSFAHGAIIVATGGVEYEPTEYCYGQSDAIMTQRQLERLLETETFEPAASFAMIQCVGSREEPFNYCSRICCQDAIKNAIAIKEKYPNASVTIFYRDIRTYGLREDYYRKARELGVLFVRFEPDRKPEVTVTSGKPAIRAFDYILGRDIIVRADYLALSTGLRPHPSTEDIGKLYKLTRNPDGYLLEAHVKLRPVDFPSEGIFVAGLAHAPKNLDETISQALAASGRAGVLLSRDRLDVSGIIAKHNRDICMSCLACFRVCPFDSPFIDEDGRISHNEVKCMGCGICAGICPAKAFQVNNFRDDQIIAMIDAIT
ncbi:MAG: heterodisulfide reductase [Desulfococcus sp. 4484_241]|nr:MAG: heterodisulfide reductase [Desulfococcus sp. 4484_241]